MSSDAEYMLSRVRELRNRLVHERHPDEKLREAVRNLEEAVHIYEYKQWKLSQRRQLSSLIIVKALIVEGIESALMGLGLIGRRNRIKRPPGSNLNAISSFLFSKKLHERVFQPIIADMQNEYVEALSKKRHWKAWWIMWRGRSAFLAAAFAQVPVSASRLLAKLWTAAS